VHACRGRSPASSALLNRPTNQLNRIFQVSARLRVVTQAQGAASFVCLPVVYMHSRCSAVALLCACVSDAFTLPRTHTHARTRAHTTGVKRLNAKRASGRWRRPGGWPHCRRSESSRLLASSCPRRCAQLPVRLILPWAGGRSMCALGFMCTCMRV